MRNKYRRKLRQCIYCKVEYIPTRAKQTCCSVKCSLKLNYENYINRWKAGLEKGWKSKSRTICPAIKRYLMEKYNNSCQLCGWSKMNKFTHKRPLTVHHIDGDAENCFENNLELLCPNCHSLTDNFGSRNKNSKRWESLKKRQSKDLTN